MKMKIIDLLNKIANGEEVPKIIKYDDFTYWYDKTEKDYYRYIGYDLDNDDVEYLINGGFISDILNDEVEIIEEEKKIPEKLEKELIYVREPNGFEHPDSELPSKEEMFNKINEILDYLYYLKSKGDDEE